MLHRIAILLILSLSLFEPAAGARKSAGAKDYGGIELLRDVLHHLLGKVKAVGGRFARRHEAISGM